MLPWSVACEANWLRGEQSNPTAWEKSAEAIVGVETSRTEGSEASPAEGPNGMRG